MVMALTGALGVVVYKVLKKTFVRERPFITHTTIDLAMAPLDRYSFPSGHTLHAVSFALAGDGCIFPNWAGCSCRWRR